MIYFVTRVKYLADGGYKKSEVMDYTDKNSALAKFHTNLGTDLVDSTLSGGLCMVMNSDGGILAIDKWGTLTQPQTEEVTA